MLAENHTEEVKHPNKPTAENTDNAGYNFAFRKSRNHTANPCRYGDDCKDQANDVAQTEIIAFFCCHFYKSPFEIILIILYHCKASKSRVFGQICRNRL